MTVTLHRVYDPDLPKSGPRVLVDRVWPRGVSRASLRLDLWARDLGPSTELRKWFGHDPSRWKEFQRRYRAELTRPALDELWKEVEGLAHPGPLILLYGARDEEHNQAVVIREVLLKRLGG